MGPLVVMLTTKIPKSEKTQTGQLRGNDCIDETWCGRTVESIGESPASAGEDVLRATEESVEVGRNDQPAYTQ